MLEKIADKIAREKFLICRNWTKEDYLTRWTLLGKRYDSKYAVYLHKFHKSDDDQMHNHPWPFVSLILSGGYYEMTPDYENGWKNGNGPTIRKWYGPGRILYRPANWIHSVKLPEGKKAMTLIFRGQKSQSWGFFCPFTGFRPWREYMEKDGLTGNGCE